MHKLFPCKCGEFEYDSNSSLYNHIRLKHNNDIEGYKPEKKLGRPKGKRNQTIIKDKSKVLPKVLKCKCGTTLKSEGALSNHIRLKHKNHPDFQTIKKKQGRKPKDVTKQQNEVQQQEIDCLETQQFTSEHNEIINTTIEGPTQNIYQNPNTTKSLQQIYQAHEDQESEIVQDQTQQFNHIEVGDCQLEQGDEDNYFPYQDQFDQNNFESGFYGNYQQEDFMEIQHNLYFQSEQFTN
ncbi:zinc finger, C2H2 type family protein (macronuclear) [Tetrahymena thermophila SB210]|uniref:Zinc finger, C2H2 type family protein n=1 Tax=Tetrahymena thermophila (strain SB210) TaxID=312017 RepID=I7MA76_TETTS|nr:zinc finger, C2H2 type family protein [Tetrahymena thermophila SB210]EAS03858.1 zinc finger, C2H2 type family protein [Tetrahymena thermophila SB210]|eukprot:XP_001024103.1 zinc finger, C2H2 type family protein [Tetrahymena thermophila SB210]